MKNKKFVGTVMVPAMLHMFVFIVIPIVIGLVISFFNYNPLSSESFCQGGAWIFFILFTQILSLLLPE